MVSYYQVDSTKSIYSIGIEDRKKADNDYFKIYFDKIGREYTEKNNKKLINKISKDYYEELLKYLSKYFIIQQNLIISTLGNVGFREIINELKKNIGYHYDNDYAIVVNNILLIETNIVRFMKKKGLKENISGFANINELMNLFIEDKEIVDGLMYINYI